MLEFTALSQARSTLKPYSAAAPQTVNLMSELRERKTQLRES